MYIYILRPSVRFYSAPLGDPHQGCSKRSKGQWADQQERGIQRHEMCAAGSRTMFFPLPRVTRLLLFLPQPHSSGAFPTACAAHLLYHNLQVLKLGTYHGAPWQGERGAEMQQEGSEEAFRSTDGENLNTLSFQSCLSWAVESNGRKKQGM